MFFLDFWVSFYKVFGLIQSPFAFYIGSASFPSVVSMLIRGGVSDTLFYVHMAKHLGLITCVRNPERNSRTGNLPFVNMDTPRRLGKRREIM